MNMQSLSLNIVSPAKRKAPSRTSRSGIKEVNITPIRKSGNLTLNDSKIPNQRSQLILTNTAQPILPLFQTKPVINTACGGYLVNKDKVTSEMYRKCDDEFTKFLLLTKDKPLPTAIEETFISKFKTPEVIVWEEIPSLHILYSRAKGKIYPLGKGILSHVSFTRDSIVMNMPEHHSDFDPAIDNPYLVKGTHMLCFALVRDTGDVHAIVQVQKRSSFGIENDASNEDLAFVDYFRQKFKSLFSIIHRQFDVDRTIAELTQVLSVGQFLILFQREISKLLDCRQLEIWKSTDGRVFKYIRSKEEIDISVCGISGECLQKKVPINASSNKMMSSYNVESDGLLDERIMCIPVLDSSTVYCITARGGKKEIFDREDEDLLKKLSQFICLSLKNAEVIEERKGNKSEGANTQTLVAIKQIADMIYAKKTEDEIITEALERITYVCKAERASIFLFDRRDLRLEEHPVIKGRPGNPMLAMSAYTSRVPSNIPDVYQTIEFEASFDIERGFKTKAVLSVPLFNSRGEAIGAGQIANHTDGTPFSEDDTSRLQSVMAILGPIIDSNRLRQTSDAAMKELSDNMTQGFSMAESNIVAEFVRNAIHGVRNVVACDGVALYLVDENQLTLFTADSMQSHEVMPKDSNVLASAIKSGECFTINDTRIDLRFVEVPKTAGGVSIYSMVVAPCISGNGNSVAVIEAVRYKVKEFTVAEAVAIRSIASIIGMALGSRSLNELVCSTEPSYELRLFIPEEERKLITIPTKLQLSSAKEASLITPDFCGLDWLQNPFSLVFSLFQRYALLSEFRIKASELFKLVQKARSLQPNFARSLDAMQFAVMAIEDINVMFTMAEKFALLTALLFVGVRNNDIESPSSKYLSRVAPLESSDSSSVVQAMVTAMNEAGGVFSYMTVERSHEFMTNVTRLVKAYDITNHFEFIAGAEFPSEGIHLKTSDERIRALEVVAKAASMSIHMRPLAVLNRWFAAHPDGESAVRKEYVGVYNVIVHPTFKTLGKAIQKLQVWSGVAEGNYQRILRSL